MPTGGCGPESASLAWVGRFVAGTLLAALANACVADEPAAPGWLTPSLTYDGSLLGNLQGGLQTGAAYVGNLHLKLGAKGASIGLPGWSASADLLTVHGGYPSGLVGDAQGVTNLQGPTGTQVEELWVQYNTLHGGGSALVGIYDLNSEFYRSQAAGLFVNSAFGIGTDFAQSGREGPSVFPRTAAGIRLAFKPTLGTVLRTAVLDGVPVVRPDGSRAAFRGGDGLLLVAEFAVLTRSPPGDVPILKTRDRIGRFSDLTPYEDKFAIGTWRYTGRYPDLSDTDASGGPVQRRGSSGAYLVTERLLLGGGEGGAGRRLSGFLQAGIADARTNRFGRYTGAGLVGAGWGWMKAPDQFGLSFAQARNGSHYRAAQAGRPTTGAETTLEATYLTELTSFMTVQPDLQYVVHPDTQPGIANAWVLQVRFEIAF